MLTYQSEIVEAEPREHLGAAGGVVISIPCFHMTQSQHLASPVHPQLRHRTAGGFIVLHAVPSPAHCPWVASSPVVGRLPRPGRIPGWTVELYHLPHRLRGAEIPGCEAQLVHLA